MNWRYSWNSSSALPRRQENGPTEMVFAGGGRDQHPYAQFLDTVQRRGGEVGFGWGVYRIEQGERVGVVAHSCHKQCHMIFQGMGAYFVIERRKTRRKTHQTAWFELMPQRHLGGYAR